MVTVFLGMTLQDKKVAVLASKICQLEERIPTSFSFMTKYSYPTFALLKT
jgi:hypothetical protein